jgi:predicted HicB family RNase H-like nuclease
MDWLHKSTFVCPIKSYQLSKDSDVSIAALENLREFLPKEIDFNKNVDLLGVAFNAALINQFNKNDDGIDSSLASSIVSNFIHKPTNIEHKREKVVGHIINAGFSDLSSDSQILSIDQIIEETSPFNLSLGAVVYRYVNEEFANLLEKSSDPSHSRYGAISASWEMGFNQYDICIGSRNLKDAEIIDEKHFKEFKPLLRAYGGSGHTKDGQKVYRLLKGEVFPLGIGFTTKPAANVKGVYSESTMGDSGQKTLKTNKSSFFDVKNNFFSQKNATSVSQSEIKNVILKNSNNMDIEKVLGELKDLLVEKKFSEEAVANMTQTFAEAIKKKDEEYRDSLTKAEKEKMDAEKEKEEMKTCVSEMKDKLKASTDKILEFENFQKQQEAVARFNSRMDSIDSEYDLDDEDRKVLASDISSLDEKEESFASYKDKLSIMWKHKNKESKQAFEKQIQARIDEEVAKKLSVSTASQKTDSTVTDLTEKALETAEASKTSIPNNNQESSTNQTLREKFAKAFSRENIQIS